MHSVAKCTKICICITILCEGRQADRPTLLTGSDGRAAHKAISLLRHISALKLRYTYPLQMLLAGLLLQLAS